MTKINPINLLLNKLKTIKKPSVVDSLHNTAEAIQILRKKSPDEIREIIFREGHPCNLGNTDLVAKLNRLMSKELAKKVYGKM